MTPAPGFLNLSDPQSLITRSTVAEECCVTFIRDQDQWFTVLTARTLDLLASSIDDAAHLHAVESLAQSRDNQPLASMAAAERAAIQLRLQKIVTGIRGARDGVAKQSLAD